MAQALASATAAETSLQRHGQRKHHGFGLTGDSQQGFGRAGTRGRQYHSCFSSGATSAQQYRHRAGIGNSGTSYNTGIGNAVASGPGWRHLTYWHRQHGPSDTGGFNLAASTRATSTRAAPAQASSALAASAPAWESTGNVSTDWIQLWQLQQQLLPAGDYQELDRLLGARPFPLLA